MGAIRADELGRLYDSAAPALRLYARQWGDPAGADDAVQEAFLSLAKQARMPPEPLGWLYRTVRNRLISQARVRRRREAREARSSRPEAWFAALDDRLDARAALESLAGLDLDHREVIVARIWGGLTFEQVAELQGCSLTTAHRRYQAGLARLAERLEPPCDTKPTPNPTPSPTASAPGSPRTPGSTATA